jgi:hypothetical protein
MPTLECGVDPDICRKQFSDLHVKVALLHKEITDAARKEFVRKEEYAHMERAIEELKKENAALWKQVRLLGKQMYAALVVLGIAALFGKLALRYLVG